MLEFSILVKVLHNIFGQITDYFSDVCFAACLPATVLHDLLRDKFLVTMWSSETVPQDAHKKFVLVHKHLVHHMQTITYYTKICIWLTRLVKLDLSVKD